MKNFIICLLAIISFAHIYAQTRDYCKPTLCQSGRHIACGNKNQFALTCPKDAKLVTGENFQGVFVKEHNRVRNQIASGALTGYQTAMRMATVSWDNELAKLAQMLAKTCISSYDECRNTQRFSAVGQNIASTTKIGSYSIAELIQEVVNNWYDENSIINRSYIAEYKIDDNYDSSRHFAQLAVDKATRIGCAIADFTEGTKTRVNIICNYSSRPMQRMPLYIEGCTVAQCLQGHNTNFEGLCSPTEFIDPNNY